MIVKQMFHSLTVANRAIYSAKESALKELRQFVDRMWDEVFIGHIAGRLVAVEHG